MMGFGMFGGMFFIWLLVIGLAVLLVRGLFGVNGSNRSEQPLSAPQILEQRFARGEITQEQFNIMMNDLQ